MNNREKFKTLQKVYELKALGHKQNLMAMLQISDDIKRTVSIGEEVFSAGRSIVSLVKAFKTKTKG